MYVVASHIPEMAEGFTTGLVRRVAVSPQKHASELDTVCSNTCRRLCHVPLVQVDLQMCISALEMGAMLRLWAEDASTLLSGSAFAEFDSKHLASFEDINETFRGCDVCPPRTLAVLGSDASHRMAACVFGFLA